MPIDISVKKLDSMSSRGLPYRLKHALRRAANSYLVKAEIWEDPATCLQHIRFEFIPEGASSELPKTFTIVADRYPGFSDECLENVAKEIEEWYNSKHPMIFVKTTSELKILKDIYDEIKSRGDFEIDIPKLVDVLFRLGCIKTKED